MSFLEIEEMFTKNEYISEIEKLRENNKEEKEKKYKKIIKTEEEDIEVIDSKESIDEILMFTGSTACLLIVDEKNNKLYFGNLGNSKIYICNGKKKTKIYPNNSNEDGNNNTYDKLKDFIKIPKSFGNYELQKNFNMKKDVFIGEYDIADDDKYIFIASESIIEFIEENKLGDILDKCAQQSAGSLSGMLKSLFENNVPDDFYNNDIQFGFDNITATLIKLKK